MPKFVIKKASNGIHYYWNLKAVNGEVIATSQMYLSKVAAETGIRSVKMNAPVATVEDTTALNRWF